jgi:large repetitive protein
MKRILLIALLALTLTGLALGQNAGSGQTASQTFTLTTVPQLQITTTTLPPVIQTATGYAAYSFQLSATGGVAPYTWKLTSGQLWPGVTLSASGLLSGTPTGPCPAPCSITITVSSTE